METLLHKSKAMVNAYLLPLEALKTDALIEERKTYHAVYNVLSLGWMQKYSNENWCSLSATEYEKK